MFFFFKKKKIGTLTYGMVVGVESIKLGKWSTFICVPVPVIFLFRRRQRFGISRLVRPSPHHLPPGYNIWSKSGGGVELVQ